MSVIVETKRQVGQLGAGIKLLDRRLWILAAGMFAIGTDSFVIAGLLPQVSRDLGISIAEASQLVTAYAASYAICTIPLATFTSQLPRRRILLFALAIFITGNVFVGVSSNYVMALTGRLLAGAGASIFAPLAVATAVTLVADNRRARALAILMMGLSAATAFGAPLGTIIGTLNSWRLTLLLISVGAAFVIGGVYLGLRDLKAGMRMTLRERVAPIHNRRVLLTLLSTFCVLSGLYVTYTFISAVFDRVTNNNGVTLALLLSVFGVAGTAGSVMVGKLSDHFGTRKIINATLAIAAINFLLLPWTGAYFFSAIIALAVWGACGWGFTIPQQHRLIGFAPELSSILLALYACAVYAGTSASGVIGALGLSLVGQHELPIIGAGLILCGLIAAEGAARHRPKTL